MTIRNMQGQLSAEPAACPHLLSHFIFLLAFATRACALAWAAMCAADVEPVSNKPPQHANTPGHTCCSAMYATLATSIESSQIINHICSLKAKAREEPLTAGALSVRGQLHLLGGPFDKLGPHFVALILLPLLLRLMARSKPVTHSPQSRAAYWTGLAVALCCELA